MKIRKTIILSYVLIINYIKTNNTSALILNSLICVFTINAVHRRGGPEREEGFRLHRSQQLRTSRIEHVGKV